MRDYFGDKVSKTVIPRNVRLSEAPSHGLPAVIYDPASRGAEAYQALGREVLERLRPALRTLRDERDRELFDLRRAPLPDPATAAPPRFLPEYDNVLLGHKDRTRITAVSGYTPVVGDAWLLVDGFVRATWRIERTDRAAVLRIAAFEPISGRDRTAVTGEGKRLLALAAPDANRRDVRFA